jgi:hypothetical protein
MSQFISIYNLAFLQSLFTLYAGDFTPPNSGNLLYLEEVGLLELGMKVAALTLGW